MPGYLVWLPFTAHVAYRYVPCRDEDGVVVALCGAALRGIPVRDIIITRQREDWLSDHPTTKETP
jgi:hypothetical protein